jgi:hypothetical protein
MGTGPQERDHKKIIELLKETDSARWLAAQHLSCTYGWKVQLNPITYGKGYDDRMRFSDTGDIKAGLRVEVKWRQLHFTDAHNFPFRDGVLVCPTHSWDNAADKPSLFLMLNTDCTHLAKIWNTSREHWNRMMITDPRMEAQKYEAYVCPLEYVEFEKVRTEIA